MRRSLVTRRLALAVSYAIGLTLAACSGGDHHDPTGPDPEPIPDPAPLPAPEPTPIPQGGIQGSYALERINDGEPGQLITIANPDGTLLAYQPYGKEGLLVADIDLSTATGLLAKRYKSTS